MATEKFSNNPDTTLNGGINGTVGSLVVTDASTFPTQPQFRILVDHELMLVTGVSSTTFSVTRGIEGSTNVPHLTGARVVHVLTAGALDQLKIDSRAELMGVGLDIDLSTNDSTQLVSIDLGSESLLLISGSTYNIGLRTQVTIWLYSDVTKSATMLLVSNANVSTDSSNVATINELNHGTVDSSLLAGSLVGANMHVTPSGYLVYASASRPLDTRCWSHCTYWVDRIERIAYQVFSLEITNPTDGQHILVESDYYLTATIIPPSGGSVISAEYQVNSGGWITLPHLSGNTYRVQLTASETPSPLVCEVRATDSESTALTDSVSAEVTSSVEVVIESFTAQGLNGVVVSNNTTIGASNSTEISTSAVVTGATYYAITESETPPAYPGPEWVASIPETYTILGLKNSLVYLHARNGVNTETSSSRHIVVTGFNAASTEIASEIEPGVFRLTVTYDFHDADQITDFTGVNSTLSRVANQLLITRTEGEGETNVPGARWNTPARLINAAYTGTVGNSATCSCNVMFTDTLQSWLVNPGYSGLDFYATGDYYIIRDFIDSNGGNHSAYSQSSEYTWRFGWTQTDLTISRDGIAQTYTVSGNWLQSLFNAIVISSYNSNSTWSEFEFEVEWVVQEFTPSTIAIFGTSLWDTHTTEGPVGVATTLNNRLQSIFPSATITDYSQAAQPVVDRISTPDYSLHHSIDLALAQHAITPFDLVVLDGDNPYGEYLVGDNAGNAATCASLYGTELDRLHALGIKVVSAYVGASGSDGLGNWSVALHPQLSPVYAARTWLGVADLWAIQDNQYDATYLITDLGITIQSMYIDTPPTCDHLALITTMLESELMGKAIVGA